MSLVINHNLMATRTANALNQAYGSLATSTQRLSTGLRVNSAADDAAGLAIRELQRADITALHQGARNANDAVSMIQVADGALAVIDEKLIRMKELAEQAATGTYDSTQRLMIDSEFQAMAAEIDRIAHATDFNGIHLLDGSKWGQHDGSGMTSTGALKIHFGPGNDSAEDYYYVEIGSATLIGLGLATPKIEIPDNTPPAHIETLADLIHSKGGIDRISMDSGIKSMSFIPAGSRNVKIEVNCRTQDDDIQLFTRDGYHILGTKITAGVDNDFTWNKNAIHSPTDFENVTLNTDNGFINGATTYKFPEDANETGNPVLHGDFNEGYDYSLPRPTTWPTNEKTVTYFRDGSADRMHITYSGDYARTDNSNDELIARDPKTSTWSINAREYVTIDYATEDILLIVSGDGSFDLEAHWDYMPEDTKQDVPLKATIASQTVDDIQTQEKAQQMLSKIDAAIVKKDKIRASLGALQNRLENTITNLNTQAENLQAAESRISDVDVATEMTNFVRNQILTQSAVAMLSQANSLPQMAMQLIGA